MVQRTALLGPKLQRCAADVIGEKTETLVPQLAEDDSVGNVMVEQQAPDRRIKGHLWKQRSS